MHGSHRYSIYVSSTGCVNGTITHIYIYEKIQNEEKYSDTLLI